MDRLRITHVVLSLDCGGLERMVLGLLRAGRAKGQEISVICVERRGALAAEAEELGAPIRCADKRPGLQVGTTGRLREIFRELRPDVVHTHQIGALLYAGRAARKASVPAVVHTEHGNHLKRLNSRLRRIKARMLFRFASRRADRFCCVSTDIAETVKAAGVDVRKVIVVPNGIDAGAIVDAAEVNELRRRFRLPEGVPIIGTVGRLAEIKRQDILLRAFAHLKKSRPDAHLLLVGDGDRRVELEALAESLGVANAVCFAGYQPRPEACLRLMDVFALTSRTEGMPVSILEAWAAGLPVAASRVGGVPELVRHGQNGLLFDFPDVAALADAMLRLLGEPSLARSLGEAGRREVLSRFDLKQTAGAYESLYRDMLRAKKGSQACVFSS